MFRLKWTIEGETELSRLLNRTADQIKNFEPAFRDSALYLKDVFSVDVFRTQGGAIDEVWQPLAPNYAKQKARSHPGKGILERTGDMKAGFMTLWRPDMAMVWNEVEYFKYHQSNQPRRGNLPRRVMMKIADAQRSEVVRIFNNYLRKAMQ